MPQPIENRIAAAMEPRARAATVADLIAELSGIITATQAEHDAQDALSKSVTATEAEADEAADAVSKLARRIIRYTAQREQLEARHAELMNSERRKQLLSDHEGIKVRRDQLATDLKAQWPALIEQMVALLHRIEASDTEIEAFQRGGVPSGCQWLESAEAMARDVPGNFYNAGGGPIMRLTKVKLPALGVGVAWPDDRAQRDLRARIAEQEQTSRLRAQQEREREAARWKRYSVVPPASGRVRLECRRGEIPVSQLAELVMTPEQAEAARAKGCVVERLQANETIGGPVSAAVFA